MWAGFATTLNQSMSWMKEKWMLMILLGSFFGPLSYYAGVKLNVLRFNNDAFYIFSIPYIGDISLYSFGIIGLLWGISIPIMFYFNVNF